jgi:hypothetical protein
MENEEIVQAQDSTVREEVVLETTNEEGGVENSNELAERLAKAEELANNYKIRAEKAEKLAKSVKTETTSKPSPTAGELSTKDLYALMEAKVPEQDVEKVQEIAKLKGISVAEAIKLPLTKQILSDEAEQRNSASAANVGASKRSSNKITDEILLAKAQKGELPTSDEDLMRLARIRKGYKN